MSVTLETTVGSIWDLNLKIIIHSGQLVRTHSRQSIFHSLQTTDIVSTSVERTFCILEIVPFDQKI